MLQLVLAFARILQLFSHLGIFVWFLVFQILFVHFPVCFDWLLYLHESFVELIDVHSDRVSKFK